MRLTARYQVVGLLAVALFGCSLAAPVPKINANENSIEAYEDGLLLFVPTVPSVDKEKSGQQLKREVEYELIAIPGELLRREIRQISQSYGPPSHSSGSPFVVQADSVEDFGDIIIPSPPGSGVPLPKPGVNLPTLPVINKPNLDLGAVLSSVAGPAQDFVGGAGQTLANVGAAGTNVLGQVGTAAASGGAQLAGWVVDQKSQGISTATQVVGGGLQYAGQLSGAVLRALLRVPGIKARVLSEVVQAGQPLVYAISDILAESSDDLADVFEAKTSIIQDVIGIVIRLVQDTLALKGRIIFTLGSSGLDIGATAFNAGVRVGEAAVESATGVASALGSGVAEIVSVGTSVNLPPPPQLPPFSLPTLPVIDVPKINIPNVDLSGLVPSKSSSLSPIPLPARPDVSISSVAGPPTQLYSAPVASPPTQLYSAPGRR